MNRLITFTAQHHARYEGIQPGPDDTWAHCVTDLDTGTTICVMSMHELKDKLAAKRQQFKEAV